MRRDVAYVLDTAGDGGRGVRLGERNSGSRYCPSPFTTRVHGPSVEPGTLMEGGGALRVRTDLGVEGNEVEPGEYEKGERGPGSSTPSLR